jgi:5-methylcytosine-specific restriction endonuclease McrA
MKTCSTCGVAKDECEFYRYSRTGTIKPSCKVCERAYIKSKTRPGYAAEHYRAKRAAGWKPKPYGGDGYKYLKRWRAAHRMQARAQDRIYKALSRPGTERDGWLAVLAHYGNACLACGSTDGVCPDHVRPVTQGGDNRASNLQPLCRKCNGGKRGQSTDYRPDQGQAFARH